MLPATPSGLKIIISQNTFCKKIVRFSNWGERLIYKIECLSYLTFWSKGPQCLSAIRLMLLSLLRSSKKHGTPTKVGKTKDWGVMQRQPQRGSQSTQLPLQMKVNWERWVFRKATRRKDRFFSHTGCDPKQAWFQCFTSCELPLSWAHLSSTFSLGGYSTVDSVDINF